VRKAGSPRSPAAGSMETSAITSCFHRLAATDLIVRAGPPRGDRASWRRGLSPHIPGVGMISTISIFASFVILKCG